MDGYEEKRELASLTDAKLRDQAREMYRAYQRELVTRIDAFGIREIMSDTLGRIRHLYQKSEQFDHDFSRLELLVYRAAAKRKQVLGLDTEAGCCDHGVDAKVQN